MAPHTVPPKAGKAAAAPSLGLCGLILAGSSAEEIDQFTSRQIDRAPSANAAAHLKHERAAAVELSGLLRWHSSRASRLQALFDIAAELAESQYDVQRMLQKMLAGVRGLLGAEVAIISLLDESTDLLSTRATDGSVSERLQAASVSKHLGLAGLVLRGQVPVSSYDYMNDSRFPSTSSIQSHMQEEGVAGIIGAPLRSAGRNIGVLFAAQREPRLFTSDESALLQSLADYCALAITNAHQVAELQRENQSMRTMSDEGRRLSERLDALTELVINRAPLAPVVASAHRALEADIEVYSTRGALLGASSSSSAGSLLSWTPRTLETVVAAGRLETETSWLVPISTEYEVVGVLAITKHADTTPTALGAHEKVAQILVLAVQQAHADHERRARDHDELLRHLFDPEIAESYEALQALAARNAMSLNESYLVVVCTPEGSQPSTTPLRTLVTQLEGEWLLAAEYRGALVVLSPLTDAEPLARAIHAQLGRLTQRQFSVTYAGPARGKTELSQAFLRARRAVSVMRRMGLAGNVINHADLGYHGLLLAPDADVPAFIESRIGALLRYDEAHNAELLSTLQSYYQLKGRIPDVSAAMHLHPNTVGQRLRRIGELLGLEWRDLQGDAQLQLAVSLHDLVRSLSGGGLRR